MLNNDYFLFDFCDQKQTIIQKVDLNLWIWMNHVGIFSSVNVAGFGFLELFRFVFLNVYRGFDLVSTK